MRIKRNIRRVSAYSFRFTFRARLHEARSELKPVSNYFAFQKHYLQFNFTNCFELLVVNDGMFL